MKEWLQSRPRSQRTQCRFGRRKRARNGRNIDSKHSLPFGSGMIVLSFMNSLLSRITVGVGQSGGRSCIRDYRLRVKDVLELLAHGASWEEIMADHSFLERDDIRACLEFAAAQNDHVVLRA